MEKRIGKTDIFSSAVSPSSASEQKRTPRTGIFARLGSSFFAVYRDYKQSFSDFSVRKPDYLAADVHSGLNAERKDAAGLGVSDIDVPYDGQIRGIDHIREDLPIFPRIGFIHGFPDQHPGKHLENTGFL